MTVLGASLHALRTQVRPPDASPLDDRLHALTQSLSDDELPQIYGVRVLGDGPDAGLYQISVTGCDGASICLGCSNGIEKASEIYDMVTLGLHGGHTTVLNFSPRRYHIEAYLNVLLTFQKLFPGNLFWMAVKRGIDAGVRVDRRSLRTNPVLNTFFSFATSRPKATPETTWIPRPVARWPPFCPPWLLSQDDGEGEASPIFDATATVGGFSGSDSKGDVSFEEKDQQEKRRVYRIPRNGIVQHRILRPFVPPGLIFHGRSRAESDASRRTRRGRSVKQPVRYREDTHLYFSDSDSIDARALASRVPKQETTHMISVTDRRSPVPQSGREKTTKIASIPVVRAGARHCPADRSSDSYVAPVFHSPPLRCYTPLGGNAAHFC